MTIFTSPLADVVIPEISITERLFQAFDSRPDRVVMIDGPTGREVTARAMMASIRTLAGGLTAQGFGAGQVVALMAPNMPEFCTVFHGVAYAGGTITTINPAYTAAEIHHQLTDSGADLLITTPDFLAVASDGAKGTGVRRIVVIGAEDEQGLHGLMGPVQAAQVPVDLARFAMVMPYSSGTTGKPKGVRLSHRNLVANVEQSLAVMMISDEETTVAILPFFHIYGMNVIMNLFLTAGMKLVTMPRFDLPTFLGHLQAHQCYRAAVVPPVVVALAKHPLVETYDLSALKILFSAAAPLGAEVAEACAARIGAQTVQGYGLTETGPVVSLCNQSLARAGSVGVILPNTECRVVDVETGAALGVGQEGELWIRGPQVMLGYLNNPAATAAMLDEDGWLHSGDLAAIDADGFVFIRDRLKELIKVKGFQVAPAEVEAALQDHPQVLDAAVLGVADDEAGEVPVAFVVPRPGADAADIAAFLRGRLATYKQPRTIEFVEAIPKTASGKILRRVLRDQMAAR